MMPWLEKNYSDFEMNFVKIETQFCPTCHKRRNITQFEGKQVCRTCRGVHLVPARKLAQIIRVDRQIKQVANALKGTHDDFRRTRLDL
jgi:hypothetical protein